MLPMELRDWLWSSCSAAAQDPLLRLGLFGLSFHIQSLMTGKNDLVYDNERLEIIVRPAKTKIKLIYIFPCIFLNSINA